MRRLFFFSGIFSCLGLALRGVPVPSSHATADVSVIDTTAILRGLPTDAFFKQTIRGHDWLATPNFAFLIHNKEQNRQVLFDLGMRRDYWNASYTVQEALPSDVIGVSVEKDVREILQAHGVPLSGIEAVVWSHHHIDHIGDMSTLESSTTLVVGPGFENNILPGYPRRPDSSILESDYDGRNISEINFDHQSARVGGFRAFDYFDDGSFYLLEAPGHTHGHLCGFIRVTSEPDSYVFLAGDAIHHAGEIRPSRHLPLPDSIQPHPFMSAQGEVLSSSIFHPILRPDGNGVIGTSSFYEPATSGHDPTYNSRIAASTIAHIQDLDRFDNVFVLMAHDEYVLGHIPFFPATINDFYSQGLVPALRWLFLRDFADAIGWTGLIPDKRDWSAPLS